MANYNQFSDSNPHNESNRIEAEKSNETGAEPPNFRPNKKDPERRKLWLKAGGGILLLFILWNVYSFASYVAPWSDERSTEDAKQDEIQQYIFQSEKSEEMLKEVSNSLIRLYDHNSLTELHINEMEEKLEQLSKELDTDDPRLEQLESYHFAQIELTREMTKTLQKNHVEEVHERLDEILDRQKEKADDKAEILISLMEQEDIRYEQKADGSIAYE
ncbi:hypothetical protein AUC31_05790 [Planococcus rifietoensis]|uniref:Uncharacterized protein n=1 Tax=Planococcus rifietoensis TaxID=200991 RepID=A0A0U2Z4G8_9BACL|nr:hypothetical protein [Planococcus rifietoensis]ALS74763.1 hypothetical protein AUC31_05790 [Planococcus rifietoensis]